MPLFSLYIKKFCSMRNKISYKLDYFITTTIFSFYQQVELQLNTILLSNIIRCFLKIKMKSEKNAKNVNERTLE